MASIPQCALCGRNNTVMTHPVQCCRCLAIEAEQSFLPGQKTTNPRLLSITPKMLNEVTNHTYTREERSTSCYPRFFSIQSLGPIHDSLRNALGIYRWVDHIPSPRRPVVSTHVQLILRWQMVSLYPFPNRLKAPTHMLRVEINKWLWPVLRLPRNLARYAYIRCVHELLSKNIHAVYGMHPNYVFGVHE